MYRPGGGELEATVIMLEMLSAILPLDPSERSQAMYLGELREALLVLAHTEIGDQAPSTLAFSLKGDIQWVPLVPGVTWPLKPESPSDRVHDGLRMTGTGRILTLAPGTACGRSREQTVAGVMRRASRLPAPPGYP